MQFVKENVISTAIYITLLIISEKFALFYETQPVIWPVSAVFLAVALSYGLRATIGPLLASFVYVSMEINSGSDAIGMGFSTTVASAMTFLNLLRALFLVKLCHIFIGRKNVTLESPKHMLRFLIIAGPVGGILGVLFVAPAVFNVPNLATDFRIFLLIRWWIAMTTGGLIFTPVLLMILLPAHRHPVPRRIYLLTSFGAIALMFSMLWFIRSEVANEIDQFHSSVYEVSQRSIRNQFDEVEDLTRSIRAAIMLKPEMTNEEFQLFTKELVIHDANYVDFLSWSPVLENQDRQTFEQSHCPINALTEKGLIPSPERNLYLPVTYLFPEGAADNVLCLDQLSEQRRYTAAIKAIQNQESTLTSPIELANNGEYGVLLHMPVIQNGRVAGIVSAVIAVDRIIQVTLKNVLQRNLFFQFGYYDGQSSVAKTFTHNQLDSNAFDQSIRSYDLNLLDQRWKISWQLEAAELRDFYSWQIDFFSTFSAFFVILMQYISYRLVILNRTIQSEVSRKTQQLKQSKLEAEEAALTKGQFLANMSHEIRTPLNAILGFSELAKGERDTDKTLEYIDGIWSSSEALLSLVNDVLDFSKIEAGKLVLYPNQFDIAQVADRLKAIFSVQILNKGLKFELTHSNHSNHDIFADDARIQQVLINLISNAVKFTNNGHIRVTLNVKILGDNKATLLATVEDSGIGISEEKQAQVFQEFTQADASITRRFGGTGLGLTISHTLTELLGGEITLRSQLGEGTTFQLTVPVELRAKKTKQTQRPSFSAERKILLVDDNTVNLKVTEALLKKSGFDVDTENNGLSAIDNIYRRKPDLVLMDMQMPGIDGLETTRRIREFYSEEQLTIVGLTANATQEDRDRCLGAGMNDHLAKPISLEKLSRCLTQWLKTPR
jgi:signal transduction histidine kinase/ActR/RegA family two-component response regulator